MTPPATPEDIDPERAIAQTEERVARAMGYVRVAMVPFVFVPLLGRPRRRWLAAAVAASSVAEAAAVLRRTRSARTLADRRLVWGDVGYCVAFAGAASAIDPEQRRKVMTAVVSYNLVSAGFAGFGFGPSPEGATAAAVLGGSWVAATRAEPSLKLVSDLLGFGLWYVTTIFAGEEFRRMGRQLAASRAVAAQAQAEIAEREREAEVAREREISHREIHEHLLPIVDAVASGRPPSVGLARLALREADRARRLLLDARAPTRPGFEAMLADVRDTYVDAGLQVTATFRLLADPPAGVAEVLVAAAREALTNATKYAGSRRDVTLFAESSEAGTEIVVRDYGPGFDAATVVPGGGFTRTYEAVRRQGGRVDVASTPGAGTKVAISWSP